jgi:mannose-6-phosphate isomerase
MFVRLENTPRDYAWGSATAIAQLQAREPSGGPEAELWIGTHAGSPTRIADPSQVGGYGTLAEWVAVTPELSIGFLLKVLAADHPLSLQAHPSIAQARAGFAREDAAGVPLTSPMRNYKDRNHKPELIVALSSTFDALCGFRSREESLSVLQEFMERGADSGASTASLTIFVDEIQRRSTDELAVSWALEWLLTKASGVHELIQECVELAAVIQKTAGAAEVAATDTAAGVTAAGVTAAGAAEVAASTVLEIAAEYPGDPGIVLALLLNRVRLTRGEALYLPAGNMHAYLKGVGIELMASSDNVLRGGLTPKHIDVAELLSVTQCHPLPVPLLTPVIAAPGVDVFAPNVNDFALVHVRLDATLNGGQARALLDGPAIVICTEGEIALGGKVSSLVLRRGEFCFVTPEEGTVTFSGEGEGFLAQKGSIHDVGE